MQMKQNLFKKYSSLYQFEEGDSEYLIDEEDFTEAITPLLVFIKDIATNWDCDSDAHRYNTTCRACEATKILEQNPII
jgi:hypothetical protein